MINAIIIDDEPKCTEMLTLMLMHYHKDICVIDTADSMQSGLAAINKHRQALQLLFLDIQMPGGDGFTLLQNIANINFKIIFTTAFDQFAIKAFKFSALDYLLKPIDNLELSATLERLKTLHQEPDTLNDFKMALRKKNAFDKLAISTLTEIKFIKLEKILCLESDNNYTTVYIENKQRLVSSKNIGYYEELLESSNFFRINNSCLVNLKKIERFIKGKNGEVELEDGRTFPVSGSRREMLMRLLGLS